MPGPSPVGRSSRRAIDVLVVAVPTTLGRWRADAELALSLERVGISHEAIRPTYGLAGVLIGRTVIEDLTVAASVSRAVGYALRRVAPRAIVFPTSLSAVFEPGRRLRRSAIRFDALAIDNRRGWKGGAHRRLEGRVLPRAAVLVPRALRPNTVHPLTFAEQVVVSLPTPIVPSGPTDDVRGEDAVLYAGNPNKKGLDIAIEAWAGADLPASRLLVYGIARADGLAYLARRRVAPPHNVEWRGVVAPAAFRSVCRRSAVYVNASRFEDFGGAQLEALMDGAILVSVATRGPIEALPIATDLAPSLVAANQSPTALAGSLRVAFSMSEDERRDYRSRASGLLASYGRAAFDQRVAKDLLPLLLSGEERL